jgi:hypothetical protein
MWLAEARQSNTRISLSLSLSLSLSKCRQMEIHLFTESDAHVRVQVPFTTAPYKNKSVDSEWPISMLHDYLLSYVPLKNFSLIWRRHLCQRRAEKFRPMLGAQDLWAGRDIYRATPPVTEDLGFSGLIRRTAPFSRLLRHARGCWGPILTRILTGSHKVHYW